MSILSRAALKRIWSRGGVARERANINVESGESTVWRERQQGVKWGRDVKILCERAKREVTSESRALDSFRSRFYTLDKVRPIDVSCSCKRAGNLNAAATLKIATSSRSLIARCLKSSVLADLAYISRPPRRPYNRSLLAIKKVKGTRNPLQAEDRVANRVLCIIYE